ncbi:MAG TPA: peptidylprolyl isomerase [Steroidobacteraceae bacterium]|jgi:peptidylprolyl isomerase|nr:peptidylprolyl isomerase [Steroidobacteraceae bacterium]
MKPPVATLLSVLLAASAAPAAAPPAPAAPAAATKLARTSAEVLAASTPSDWRTPDPQNTLYLELAAGRVVIEMAPGFAPHHVANVTALARGGYFDGLAIVRAQDNYVVQWADPDAKKPVGAAQRTVNAEFERPLRGLTLVRLPDPDTYAPEVGFSEGFPAAADPSIGRAWLVHCYGMVGAGRDNDVDSGGGTEIYVVIGQAPRHLDRNVTLFGRVLEGMELLSVLPRGSGALGFYEHASERVPIKSLRVAADVPAAQRTDLEVLRTDTPTFQAYLAARRNRTEEWFKVPAGHVDVCNVPIPVRKRHAGGAAGGKSAG